MCGNITRLKKLSEYSYEIAIDNIFNFVKYTWQKSTVSTYAVLHCTETNVAHTWYVKY